MSNEIENEINAQDFSWLDSKLFECISYHFEKANNSTNIALQKFNKHLVNRCYFLKEILNLYATQQNICYERIGNHFPIPALQDTFCDEECFPIVLHIRNGLSSYTENVEFMQCCRILSNINEILILIFLKLYPNLSEYRLSMITTIISDPKKFEDPNFVHLLTY